MSTCALSLVLTALAQTPSSAPMLYLPTVVDQVYTPSDVTAPHDGQKLNIFFPLGTPEPPDGYPVLIILKGTFKGAKRDLFFGAGMLNARARTAWACLEAGMAVVSATITVARGGDTENCTGNGDCLDEMGMPYAPQDVPYDPDEDLYGPPYKGNGLHFPPGVNPQGDPIEPYRDPDRPYAIKDAIYVMQYLRENPVHLGGRLDTRRMILDGDSGGCLTAQWVALGPDRAGDLVPPGVMNPDPQHSQSTRPNAFISRRGPVYMPLMLQTIPIFRYPDANDFDLPAATLADTVPGYQFVLAAVTYDSGSPPPTYLAYTDLHVTTDFIGPSYETNMETTSHSAAFGAIWKARYPKRSRFVIYSHDSNGVMPDFTTDLEDLVVIDALADQDSAFIADTVAWILRWIESTHTVLEVKDPLRGGVVDSGNKGKAP